MEAENNRRAKKVLCRNTHTHWETDTRAGIGPGWLLNGGRSPAQT